VSASGTADLDFGAFPGKSDASVAVTGQTGIGTGSLVEAWLRPVDTADHTADEHLIETLRVLAGNIIAGTGFTIYGFNTNQINEPDGAFATRVTDLRRRGLGTPPNPGKGTRLYGVWKCAWVWL
jgi:hypothetical protein